MIKASDIKARHPYDLYCTTDAEYAVLANRIYDCLQKNLKFLNNDNKSKNICISIALYFEDIQSGTHQFEVFTKLYKEMFGLYLPFYSSEDAKSPTAELDAMTFVIWHSIVAERHIQMVNPLNNGLIKMAKEILELWKKEKKDIPANETLADFLYCEETQENPFDVRDILSWIENRSFLGWWYNNKYTESEEDEEVFFLDNKTTFKHREYTSEYVGAFARQAWPISMPAKHIYAEMIRMEMEDPEDSVATEVEKMEFSEFGFHRISKVDNTGFILKDFKDDMYRIPCTRKDRLDFARKNTFILCSLFSYKGVWFLNGMTEWIKTTAEQCSKIYEEIFEQKKYLYQCVNDSCFASRNPTFREAG